MKEYKMIKKEKGITLIALVVTIVVLLILAAVSISMLTGENGVVTQAQNSKEETEQSKCEELVTVAINSLLTDNLGDRSKITPQDIAEEVNRMENRTDIVAEGNTFPTNILFTEENRKVGVNIEIGVTDPIEESIYSEPGAEDNIAPENIFLYEIIEGTGEIGATDWNTLPTKEARIIGIDPKYCNSGGYDPGTGLEEYEGTNYEIILEDGTKISDTLVIPYQKEIDGEMYKITEVDLSVYWKAKDATGYSMPKVKTIIFPNTVKKISNKGYASSGNTIENVILPKNLIILGDKTFSSCRSLRNITIPDSVTSIGKDAFGYCDSLTSIEIPNGVTSIENSAFRSCKSLTSITIPSSVTSIGYDAFEYCDALQTINYTGTEEQWKTISGIAEAEVPSSATINYNYTGE